MPDQRNDQGNRTKGRKTKQTVVEILKTTFQRELLYTKTFNITSNCLRQKKLQEEFAVRFMTEVKKDWNELDRKKYSDPQTQLIKQINEFVSPNVFANFIPNYKNIATVGSYFYSKGSKPKVRLLIEDRVKTLVSSRSRASKEDTFRTVR